MINITPICEAVLAVGWVIMIVLIAPAIEAKLTEQELRELKEWVRIAVQAAEMIYKESGMGEQKKRAVIDFLNAQGYEVDLMEIDALIESAVLELKRGVA